MAHGRDDRHGCRDQAYTNAPAQERAQLGKNDFLPDRVRNANGVEQRELVSALREIASHYDAQSRTA